MKKEIYLKELDFLTEEIKWWMTILLWLLSGSIGFIFTLIQGKIILNDLMLLFSIVFLSFIIYTNIKITKTKQKRKKLLEKFKKDKKC